MLADLHNHTALCNHATGTMDEYVARAIALGTRVFGFSDHAPMEFDAQYRMSFAQMDEYESGVARVREKFAKDCEVLCGYEVDFIAQFPHLTDARVLSRDVDYLIGSVHFLGKFGFDNPEYLGVWAKGDADAFWQEYFDSIEALANTRKFDILGHLDLIKIFKFMPKKDIKSIAKNAIKAIKKADMVVELNTAGLRKPIGEIYPSEELLEMVSDAGIAITFGSDAHSPEQIGYGSDEAINLARKFGYDKIAIFHKREREFIRF